MTTINISNTVEIPKTNIHQLNENINQNVSNPLLNASQTIFSILDRINLTNKTPDIELLQQTINHELNLFFEKIKDLNYSIETLMISRYLLCATIDDIIENIFINDKFSLELFQPFTPQGKGRGPKQRFFAILHKIMKSSRNSIDLIELSYLCLLTGFKGKYRAAKNGEQQIDFLLDELNQIITSHRKKETKNLFSQKTKSKYSLLKIKRYKHLKIFGLSVLFSLLTIYMFSSYFLNNQANNLSLQLTHSQPINNKNNLS